MSQDFCVIDIGTNAVKCKMFSGGEYYTPQNKFLSNEGTDNLNPKEVVSHVVDFIAEAEAKNIEKKRIFIAATEGFRTSSNQEKIKEKISAKTGRKVHLISPRKEAWLAVLGGLSSIRFKGERPKQVLFIESGGGSTEISLVNTADNPISLISTTSLPLGSKRHLVDENDEKTQRFISQRINEMLRRAKDKGISIDKSLRVVINSSAATRMIGKQYGMEKYNPLEITQKQYKMSLGRFYKESLEILKHPDAEKLMQEYLLKAEVVDGFIGHTYILNHILETLKKRSEEPFLSRVPITTTIGGLKDGLMDEILKEKDKTPEEIEKKLFLVGQDKEDEKDDEEEDEEEPQPIDDVKSKVWQKKYETYYKAQNPDYVCTTDPENHHLTVEDQGNKVIYTEPEKVLVSANKESKDNKLYEDMIKLAKEQGLKDIKFEPDVDLETRLRIYAACQKNGMKVQNFIYNPKMLEAVSPETRKIVEASFVKPQTKYREAAAQQNQM